MAEVRKTIDALGFHALFSGSSTVQIEWSPRYGRLVSCGGIADAVYMADLLDEVIIARHQAPDGPRETFLRVEEELRDLARHSHNFGDFMNAIREEILGQDPENDMIDNSSIGFAPEGVRIKAEWENSDRLDLSLMNNRSSAIIQSSETSASRLLVIMALARKMNDYDGELKLGKEVLAEARATSSLDDLLDRLDAKYDPDAKPNLAA